ncbi:HNH endonuclease [Maribacter sp. R86514]|uniref:HNH endonuclease n=1 Tax=Maribacter sp. R86514 TaxID=3093854 RepID=UPI0037C634BE
MTEKEYFNKSEQKKLPARCPILDYCTRRAYTLYFLGGYTGGQKKSVIKILQENDTLKEDFEENAIELSGEVPEFLNGKNFKEYANFCPEVNLFDSVAFNQARGTASISGEWEDSRKIQFENKKYRHYSECAEFSKHHYQKVPLKKSPPKRRIGISQKLRFEIFQRDNFTCQYCGKSREDDNIKLELDHIMPVSAGGTDDYHNLITSCKKCNQGKSNKVIKKGSR